MGNLLKLSSKTGSFGGMASIAQNNAIAATGKLWREGPENENLLANPLGPQVKGLAQAPDLAQAQPLIGQGGATAAAVAGAHAKAQQHVVQAAAKPVRYSTADAGPTQFRIKNMEYHGQAAIDEHNRVCKRSMDALSPFARGYFQEAQKRGWTTEQMAEGIRKAAAFDPSLREEIEGELQKLAAYGTAPGASAPLVNNRPLDLKTESPYYGANQLPKERPGAFSPVAGLKWDGAHKFLSQLPGEMKNSPGASAISQAIYHGYDIKPTYGAQLRQSMEPGYVPPPIDPTIAAKYQSSRPGFLSDPVGYLKYPETKARSQMANAVAQNAQDYSAAGPLADAIQQGKDTEAPAAAFGSQVLQRKAAPVIQGATQGLRSFWDKLKPSAPSVVKSNADQWRAMWKASSTAEVIKATQADGGGANLPQVPGGTTPPPQLAAQPQPPATPAPAPDLEPNIPPASESVDPFPATPGTQTVPASSKGPPTSISSQLSQLASAPSAAVRGIQNRLYGNQASGEPAPPASPPSDGSGVISQIANVGKGLVSKATGGLHYGAGYTSGLLAGAAPGQQSMELFKKNFPEFADKLNTGGGPLTQAHMDALKDHINNNLGGFNLGTIPLLSQFIPNWKGMPIHYKLLTLASLVGGGMGLLSGNKGLGMAGLAGAAAPALYNGYNTQWKDWHM